MSYKRQPENIWEIDFGLFVKRWHMDTVGRQKNDVGVHWMNGPSHPDRSCCGIIVMATVHSNVNRPRRCKTAEVTSTTLNVMRLRFLRVISTE
ncbi:Ubiquitin carboxyl-terminal hydrolase [Phytophthora megakarya]|uniref:Ubiquitin carboxyl-terminal hydrolase n=1 Tax=Phytophthora megakarya TaxID=4795 RepID=A0A225VQK8_9STRA|nr:Ubiquitin carboxyl-terminal hydrolase [Phytophthora megakarya]